MDPSISMDPGTSRSASRMLPPTRKRTFDSQSESSGDLLVNTDERLAAMAATLDQLCEYTRQNQARMDRFSEKLETVARLEAELARRNRIDENLFDRVRMIENQTGLNSHGRDVTERLIIPIVASLLGAGLTYGILQIM